MFSHIHHSVHISIVSFLHRRQLEEVAGPHAEPRLMDRAAHLHAPVEPRENATPFLCSHLDSSGVYHITITDNPFPLAA